MNYYDALLHHRNRIEDAARQQENARHLRDSQRTQEDHQTETEKKPSAFLRLVSDAKTAVTSLTQIGQKRVMHAGHAVAIKDVSC